jgi:hypothetical protein
MEAICAIKTKHQKEHGVAVGIFQLPPYSPELNPAEQIWNILRRNYFANRVSESLDAATAQAEFGPKEMAANKSSVRSLTNWPWINAILKASMEEEHLQSTIHNPGRNLFICFAQ